MHTLKLGNRNKYINISEEKTHINSTKSKQSGIAPFLIGTWTGGIFFLSIWLKSDPQSVPLYFMKLIYLSKYHTIFKTFLIWGNWTSDLKSKTHLRYHLAMHKLSWVHSTIYIFKKAIPLWEKIFSQIKIKLHTHSII